MRTFFDKACPRFALGRALPRRLLSAAAIVGLLAAGGAPAQPAPERIQGMRVDALPAQTLASRARAAYEYHVLAGEMAIERGQRVVAARQYVAALDYSKDASLAKRATRIALYAKKPELAWRAARAWAAAAPKSLDAQRSAARLALSQGDAKALARYAPALVAAAASPSIGYDQLINVLGSDPAHADLALATLGALADKHAHSAAAQYALGVVAFRYQREDIAARAARRALELNPDRHQAVLLQAGVWIRAGKTARAKKLVAGLPGNAATRAQYHIALARLLIDADQNKAALAEFRRALELRPQSVDARYGLGVLALSLDQLDRAQKVFKQLYQDGKRADDAAYYLGAIHEQREQYARAQRWYQKVENGSHALDAQVRAARMIYQQNDLAGAQKRLTDLRDVYPAHITRLYGVQGELYLAANKLHAALERFDQGLAQKNDSDALRYRRSVVYEKLGKIKAAKADLHAILAHNPDDAPALNALGYMLSNHGDDYARAKAYIARALKAEPDNPAIIDSMGWVEYRLGHLDKAQRYLERAYSRYRDPEVAAHLGEVLWQQGKHAAARRIWKQARAENPDQPVLRKTMARFKQGR